MQEDNQKNTQPTIAPGMEMDELEAEATKEEIERGEYTRVTQLVRDFVPDEE